MVLQDGRKTQRGRIKQEFQQKFYGICHQFRDLIRNKKHVKSLIWHDEERIKDGSFDIRPIPWLGNELTKCGLK